MPGEAAGLVPGPQWKSLQRHLEDRKWYLGETLNVAIGQGQMTATPLQMAHVLVPFVNGGYGVRPYVVERAETPDGTLLYRNAPVRQRIHGWDADAAAWVVDGLRDAFRAREPWYGTAWRAKLDHLDFIGKTGTAQVVKLEDANNRRKTEDMPFGERDHAWFVGAVLDRDPTLVVAVFVEHGGHASESAVPIVNAIFNRIYPKAPPPAADDRLASRRARTGPDTLEYRFTIDDPTVWSTPWTGMFTYVRGDTQYELVEYACHEGNYGMTNILSGARSREEASEQGR